MYLKELTQKYCILQKFHENSELGTTYLSRIDMAKSGKIKAEEYFPISE